MIRMFLAIDFNLQIEIDVHTFFFLDAASQ